MRNKILLTSVAVMLVVSLVIGGCAKPAPAPTPAPTPAPAPAPAPAEPIVHRGMTLTPEPIPPSWPVLTLIDAINEACEGEYHIDYLGGCEIMPWSQYPIAL